MANQLCKPIKKALAAKYGFKNVTVKNATGTAWGWVHIKVEVAGPEKCFCQQFSRCQECKKLDAATCNEAREIAYKALHELNLKFHTYCSDDGYNSDRDCVLIDSAFKKPEAKGIPMASMRDFDKL
jgi:hypothetical protein